MLKVLISNRLTDLSLLFLRYKENTTPFQHENEISNVVLANFFMLYWPDDVL